jgi:hypothetical protein
MKNLVSPLFCCLLAAGATAQPVKDNATAYEKPAPTGRPEAASAMAHLPAKPVRWPMEKPVKIGSVDRATFKLMTLASDVLARYVQDSCLAAAEVNAVWHGEYCSSPTATARELRSSVILRFPAAASGDGGETGGQPGGELTLAANDLHFLFRDSALADPAAECRATL